MLSRNPDSLAKLLTEIKDTLGDATSPTYDQIKSMKYANAVFHETLRLYPSVPTEIKTANQDDTLPDGTFVPKGAVVSWSPYCMGRTTAIWGPDAKEFRPERWLEMERNPSPFDYPVFNAGPRVCLGKNMAELEGVFVIVSMLRVFEVSVLEGEKVTYANSVTLPMKDGLKVKVCKRRDV
jgi:cytochrome P450